MKRNYRYARAFMTFALLFVMIGLASLFLSSCNESNKEQITSTDTLKPVYYCPMHHDVRQDHPGKCPKPECNGMELVLKDNDADLGSVLKPVSSSVLSKIKLINPVYKTLPVEINALGYIDYDNNTKSDISSRFSGRIEKLYVKYNYQPIKKGELIFEIYNPDLVTAQENFVYLLKNSPEERSTIEAAKQKLIQLQLTDDQVKDLEKTMKVKLTIPVYSNYTGHIHEMLDNLPTGVTDQQKSGILNIREGMYVEQGQTLFNVVNPQKVVVMLNIKSTDIGKIHLGEKVVYTIGSDTTMKMTGKIDLVEPVFGSTSKTMRVRVNLDNAEHGHKVGSLINARIVSDDLEALWLPSGSVIDLGKDKIVWVWKKDVFIATKVETGIQVNGMIEIADGITEANQVASEAHFLTDSESFIKVE